MARTRRLQSGGRTDAATPCSFATDMREGSFVLGYGGGGRGNLPHSSSRLLSMEGYFRSQGLSAVGVFARASLAPTSTAPTYSRVPDSVGRVDHFLHDVYSQSIQWESVEQLEREN
jgi:hypothetical protein